MAVSGFQIMKPEVFKGVRHERTYEGGCGGLES